MNVALLIKAVAWLFVWITVLAFLWLLRAIWLHCFDDGVDELLAREFGDRLVSRAPGASDTERTLPFKICELMRQKVAVFRDVRKISSVSLFLVSVAIVCSQVAVDLTQHALAVVAAVAIYVVYIVLYSIYQWSIWRQGDIDHGIGAGVRKLRFKVCLAITQRFEPLTAWP
jgi:hypothetical protein